MTDLRDTLATLIERLAGVNLLVAGDLILDEYVWGRVERISPEAPVPVVEVTKENVCLGGAANVAVNIAALGGIPLLVGVVGRDRAGRQLLGRLQEEKIAGDSIVLEEGRTTSVKTRIIAHHQQVCRTDRESRKPLSDDSRTTIKDFFKAHLKRAKGVVISDYSKGVASSGAAADLIRLASAAGLFVTVDPKSSHFSVYAGASLITPNLKEAERASGVEIQDDASLREAARRLQQQCGSPNLLVTQGEDGMTLFEGDRQHQIPTMAREVFDVTGAGDTVVAVFTLAVAAGAGLYNAALLSNLAAGIVVGKLGTATANRRELLEAVGSLRLS